VKQFQAKPWNYNHSQAARKGLPPILAKIQDWLHPFPLCPGVQLKKGQNIKLWTK
jgi:hypothetical protein